ncbi:MAG TPA: hypothetical protein VG013_00090 [Gemmataceae bacterium]|jgi:hypothetical protein|nr:hypothetical protein [Gemmataceae bacterium]
MFPMLLGWLLVTVAASADKAATYATLDKLAAEAETTQAYHPDRWKHYQEQAERVFAENDKVIANWKRRNNPPPPDLTPLKLPLPFLVGALRQEERTKGGAKPGQAIRRQDPGRRHGAFLMTVVHSPDERRIPALLEYRDHYLGLSPQNKHVYSWGRLLADAATLKWAAARVRELARQDPALDPNRLADSLLFCLIDRFARELPPASERVAYAYIRKQAPHGPTGNNDARFWDVLLRLDPARARKEILPYFTRRARGSAAYNYRVPNLLARHAGPSPEAAVAVRRWLATEATLTAYTRQQLRVILLRADPARELKPTARYIDKLLADQTHKHERFEFGGDVHMLVLALGEVELKAADAYLARYTFDRAIDTGVRLLLLEALVRRRYAQAPELAARWLAEEPPHMQDYLRKEAATQWGPYGRDVLAKAELLKAKGAPQQK